MRKGIFWCIYQKSKLHLVTVNVKCTADGESDEVVEYSSKSGENFNHKEEWKRLDREITGRMPYNYYPRGRVEIKNGKCTVYMNPDINTEEVEKMIMDFFELNKTDKLRSVNFKSDGSAHYRSLCKNN